MRPHNGIKGGELQPPQIPLALVRVVDVKAEVAAGVGAEIGKSGGGIVDNAGDLRRQLIPGGGDVARPALAAVALHTGDRTAGQGVDAFGVAFDAALAFVHAAVGQQRIHRADHAGVAPFGVVARIALGPIAVFRFVRIDPDGIHAFGEHGVVDHAPVHRARGLGAGVIGIAKAGVRAVFQDKARVIQPLVGFGLGVEGRPYRDGSGHMVLVQRVQHLCGIRPRGFVPSGDAVEAVGLPPVIVDDQRIQRNFLLAEGVHRVQQLVLRRIAVAGLHITERVFRQHGRLTGDGAVTRDDRIRIRTIEEEIVHAVGRDAGVLIGFVAVQPFQPPVADDVKQNAVAHVGIEHRRAFAGVGLFNLDRLTLDAHGAVDVAEAVQRFVIIRHKPLGDLVGVFVLFFALGVFGIGQGDSLFGAVALFQNQIARRVAVGDLAGGFVNGDGELRRLYRQHIVRFGDREVVKALVVVYRIGFFALVRQLVAGCPANVDGVGGAYFYLHDGAVDGECQHVLFFLLGWGTVRGCCVHYSAGQQ